MLISYDYTLSSSEVRLLSGEIRSTCVLPGDPEFTLE